MIFFSLRSIKLARRTSHDELTIRFQTVEDRMKMLLYAGSKKELKQTRKEYETLRGALLYQYTPQYTHYIEKLQHK